MAKFTFYHVTDCHTESVRREKTQEDKKRASERGLVLESVFNFIIGDEEVDTVVISGDNSNHGYPEEHEEFIARAMKLKEAGKKVYVTTATHDFGLQPVFENGDSMPKEGVCNRRELPAMYENLGMSDATAAFDSYSYVVKPRDGFRIICLNDDGNGKNFCGWSEPQKEWIASQVSDCINAGDYPIAVTHHPVIPPTPIYPIMSSDSMIGDYKKTGEFLADCGIKFIFTGHTHMQSIQSLTTKKGNRLFEINTGTIAEYPLVFRKVTIDSDGRADIETIRIPEVPFDTEGKTPSIYFRDKFDETLLGAIEGMANDFDEFVHQISRISVSEDSVRKLKIPLTIVGKFLNSVTLGGLGRMLFCPGKVDESIKKEKFKYLLAAFFRNVWGGDEPYGPDTPEYKAVMAYLGRLKPIWSKPVKGTDFEDLTGLVGRIIYDPTPDSDAHLE